MLSQQTLGWNIGVVYEDKNIMVLETSKQTISQMWWLSLMIISMDFSVKHWLEN